jgi:hypothetical protein
MQLYETWIEMKFKPSMCLNWIQGFYVQLNWNPIQLNLNPIVEFQFN